MEKVNKEALNNKSISFIDKYFPFRKAHAETGISLIDFIKERRLKRLNQDNKS